MVRCKKCERKLNSPQTLVLTETFKKEMCKKAQRADNEAYLASLTLHDTQWTNDSTVITLAAPDGKKEVITFPVLFTLDPDAWGTPPIRPPPRRRSPVEKVSPIVKKSAQPRGRSDGDASQKDSLPGGSISLATLPDGITWYRTKAGKIGFTSETQEWKEICKIVTPDNRPRSLRDVEKMVAYKENMLQQ